MGTSFAVPFLGSLSGMVEKAVPALNHANWTCDANSAFKIAGGSGPRPTTWWSQS